MKKAFLFLNVTLDLDEGAIFGFNNNVDYGGGVYISVPSSLIMNITFKGVFFIIMVQS